MPWQTVPSLLIIFGAFNAAAGLIYTIDKVSTGKKREIGRDKWRYAMEKRDERVAMYRAGKTD
eukprot:CAMPEP_0171327902 /NCGR_PEP_ID=MMETSP0878-20121228/318_1 /TAXON_ID=67004 /ORGANISM="Thalassiosira weissflogii, Strain CCMP1336" /LENGTH=62 /DNA_ID=CAMNT_0011827713 /DNA_START=43 /DNA_END=231 /DNA_ORIENTATION=-